ncbi:MAG: DUF3500 domain-containing protein [Dehalococcoidia bacterium]
MGYTMRVRPPGSARRIPDPFPEGFTRMLGRRDDALAQPFKGVTADGTLQAGLFPIRETGVSTQPIVDAANAFLAALPPEMRARGQFPLDSDEWRTWVNAEHYILRNGLPGMDAMDDSQREAAFNLMRSTLSDRGFELSRKIMQLNGFMGDLSNNHEDLDKWLYFFKVFGTPSTTEPWGWQIDGHHLIVNCFVLGDQVVMSPVFMGAEPTIADRGPLKGMRSFDEETQAGLELIRSLTPQQQDKAVLFRSILSTDLPPERYDRGDGRHRGGAFKDNLILPYEGLRGDEMTADQQQKLLDLAEVYIGRMRPGHDRVRMQEIEQHLGDTYFAWMGGFSEGAVFYYKVHSPVVLIEFDHHRGVFLDVDEPVPFHIHTIVRTPNGNDYGKDLLRQHLELFHKGERR